MKLLLLRVIELTFGTIFSSLWISVVNDCLCCLVPEPFDSLHVFKIVVVYIIFNS